MSHHRSDTECQDAPEQSIARDRSEEKPLPLWHNRDYVLLWSGQMISTIGSEISLLAFPVFIFTLTGSPMQAAFMSALRIIPFLLFGLPAGALIDRWNRKLVMIVCDSIRGFALGSIPLAFAMGHLSLLQIYIVSFIEGTLSIFFGLAATASLPRLVSEEQLGEASAQNEFISSTSLLAGPSLSGFLFNLGLFFPFLADAVSYLGSVVSLLFIRGKFQAERQGVQRRLHHEIAEGLTWLWHQPALRFQAFLNGGLMLACSGYVLILIMLVENLGGSTVTLGLILGCGGIGSIAGTFLAGPLIKRFRFGPLFIVATWIWAITWLPFALAPNAFVLGIGTVCSFVIVPIHLTLQYTYRLKYIPDQLLGRVSSVFRLILFASQTLSLVLTGFLLQYTNTVATVWILFVPQVILAVLTMIYPPIKNARL